MITQLYVIIKNIQRENCLCYMMGDFNINSLNVDKHVLSSEFIECMYIPVSSKPTRVSTTSATLTED